VTLESDWARFTEADLHEANERLTRLSAMFRLDEWDLPRAGAWTLREIALHVGTPWYAEQVGDLTAG
jgi:hypothetical protein